MKNKLKFLGIITLTAVVGFFLLACGDEDDGTTSGPLGPTLNFSKRVYTANYTEDDIFGTKPVYSEYNGPILSFDAEGTSNKATVSAAGVLNFTMGTPNADVLLDISDLIEEISDEMFTNINFSDSTIKAFALDGFRTQIGSYDYSLSRNLISGSVKENADKIYSVTLSISEAIYVYVNKDVTLTGTGKTITGKDAQDVFGMDKVTSTNLNILLKKGWNIIRYLITMSGTVDEDLIGTKIMARALVGGESSNLMWVMDIIGED